MLHVERQENTHVSLSFPNCPISSSSAFLSQEHNPDSIYRYYTQTRSLPALQLNLNFLFPQVGEIDMRIQCPIVAM